MEKKSGHSCSQFLSIGRFPFSNCLELGDGLLLSTGNSFLYRAAVPKKKALRRAVRDFSSRVLDGVLSPFVAYYAEEKDLTPEDVAQLEEILKRYRREGGK